MKKFLIYGLLIIISYFFWEFIDWVRLWLFWENNIWTSQILIILVMYNH